MNKVLTTCGTLALESPSATAVSARSCPVRDITKAVVQGASGGTDAVTCRNMAGMERDLPVSFTVINHTEGVARSSGMVYRYNQSAGGDTPASTPESSGTAAVQGRWGQWFDLWHSFPTSQPERPLRSCSRQS